MTLPVSPGVYSSFTDLFTAPQNLPSTRAFIAFVSNKGEDNKVKFLTDPYEFLEEYGNTLETSYGAFRQGYLNALQMIKSGMGVYCMRVLPNYYSDGSNTYASATRANVVVRLVQQTATSPVEALFEQLDMHGSGEDGSEAFFSSSVPSGYINHWPLMTFYALGRGEWYNRISFRFTKIVNKENEYIMDIYETSDDNQLYMKESWVVAFQRDKYGDDGTSIFIENVLLRSKYLRCKVNDEWSYDVLNDILMQADIASGVTVPSVIAITADPPDSPVSGDQYFISDGGRGDFLGHDGSLATFNGTTWTFSLISIGNYFFNQETGKYYTHYGNGYVELADFYAHDLVFETGTETYANGGDLSMKELGAGSDGDMWTSNGSINVPLMTKFMADAYGGVLDPSIYDLESTVFDLVYDAKYPVAVKDQIYFLCAILRKDCHGFIDGNDATDPDEAILYRKTEIPYNTMYISEWFNYSKVEDPFSGYDIWVAPTYHLSYIVPRSDIATEIWYAFAGERRGTCDLAKELRWHPSLGDRDNLYLAQCNYITQLDGVNVLWQQLTTLKVAVARQDINITRLILYIDRAFKAYCRKFIYEPNDPISYGQIRTGLINILEDIKKLRGLDNYSVNVHASDYDRKLKRVYVDTILTPTRAIEKIILRHFID